MAFTLPLVLITTLFGRRFGLVMLVMALMEPMALMVSMAAMVAME